MVGGGGGRRTGSRGKMKKRVGGHKAKGRRNQKKVYLHNIYACEIVISLSYANFQ